MIRTQPAGREKELAVLAGGLDAAAAGSGQLLTVTGDAGIGKTTVAAAVVFEARARGLTVLRAHAGPLDRDYPFGVARQAFAPLQAAPGWGELCRGPAALGERALTGDNPLDGPYAATHGLFCLTAAVTARRPALLVVDDAHWADIASQHWLAALARRVDELPLTLVLTVEAGSEPQLAELLTGTVIALGPLDPTTSSSLLRERFPAAEQPFLAACHAASGGNPYLLNALLSHSDGRSTPAVSPGEVARWVSLRLSRLPDGCAALATGLAVLGPAAMADAVPRAGLGPATRLADAAALAGLTPDRAAMCADALRAAGILGPDDWSPANPMIASALMQRIGAASLSRWHARAADLLAAAGTDPERAAAHLLRVEPARRSDVVALLRAAAAKAAGRGAPESAAAYLRRALDEPAEEPDVDAAVRLDLALALAAVRQEGAQALAYEAVARITDPAARAEAALRCGRALAISAHSEAAIAVLRLALSDPVTPALGQALSDQPTPALQQALADQTTPVSGQILSIQPAPASGQAHSGHPTPARGQAHSDQPTPARGHAHFDQSTPELGLALSNQPTPPDQGAGPSYLTLQAGASTPVDNPTPVDNTIAGVAEALPWDRSRGIVADNLRPTDEPVAGDSGALRRGRRGDTPVGHPAALGNPITDDPEAPRRGRRGDTPVGNPAALGNPITDDPEAPRRGRRGDTPVGNPAALGNPIAEGPETLRRARRGDTPASSSAPTEDAAAGESEGLRRARRRGIPAATVARIEAEIAGAAGQDCRTMPLVRELVERCRGEAPVLPLWRVIEAVNDTFDGRPAGDNLAVLRPLLDSGVLDAEHDSVLPTVAGLTLIANGDLGTARAMSERVAAAAGARGWLSTVAHGRFLRSLAVLPAGLVTESIADARAAVEFKLSSNTPPAGLLFALCPLIDALVEADRIAEAEALIGAAFPGEPPRHALSGPMFLQSRGRLRCAQGRTVEAITDLRAAGQRWDELGVRHPALATWRADLVAASVASGVGVGAGAGVGVGSGVDYGLGVAGLARECLALAEAAGVPGALSTALRMVAMTVGREERVGILERAVDVCVGTPARLAQAYGMVSLGSALRRVGRREPARAPLRTALEIADAGGAHRLANRARAELNAAGARPRRVATHGPAALTEAEQQVAGMAAGGLTNREIAQRLVLSRRTIETHLAHAYHKLGIASRRDLGAALGSEGPAD